MKNIKHEKSAIRGITHVAAMTREVWVSEACDNIYEVLPDVTYARFGHYRHRVKLVMQGRAAKCHKCGERGHLRRSCVFCLHCRVLTHDTGAYPLKVTCHWSDTPLVRHTIGPTHQWSDTPLVRQSMVGL